MNDNIKNIIASFAIAILSGLGVGSGGLLVIWLTEFMGYIQTQARSLNLLFFLFSASAALFLHLRQGRLNFRLVALISCAGIAGAIFGTYLGANISSDVIRRIFGGMLILSGIYSLFKKDFKEIKENGKDHSSPKILQHFR